MKEHEITDKTLITYLTRLKGFCGIVWYASEYLLTVQRLSLLQLAPI